MAMVGNPVTVCDKFRTISYNYDNNNNHLTYIQFKEINSLTILLTAQGL